MRQSSNAGGVTDKKRFKAYDLKHMIKQVGVA